MIYSSSKNVSFERLSAEVVQLKDRILGYQEQVKSLQGSLESAEASKERQKQHYESIIAQKDAVIKELKNRVAHMAAVADHDGTNTGIPTASTPINKKKVIPNSRRGSGRKKAASRGMPAT